MSFTYDPTTDRGKVRLYCYDTDSTNYEFEDNEIDAFLEENSESVLLSAADICRVLAIKAAPTAYILKLPGALELDKKKIAGIYNNLAIGYEKKANGIGQNIVEYIDSFDIDIDIYGSDESEYV